MQLRPYQLHNKKLLFAALKEQQRVICALPTGAGKTVLFSDIAKTAIDNGKAVLVMVDRLQLMNQTAEKFSSFGMQYSIIQGSSKKRANNCYIASIQTLGRRPEMPEVDVIIVDECHKEIFDDVLQKSYPNTKVIGFSATPKRPSNSKKPLSATYQEIVQETQISDLIKIHDQDPTSGLVPAIYYLYNEVQETKKIKGGDFDTDEMFGIYDNDTMYGDVVINYEKYAKGEKTIVFCVNRAHSLKTMQSFIDAGHNAIHLDGNDPDHVREAGLEQFRNGDVNILCNCNLYTTGFDEPSITCVIIDRQTKSIPLWLQMCGRGSRPFPNKKWFKIIDHGGNRNRLGWWDEDRRWSLHPQKNKSDKQGVAPAKKCPVCDAANHASASVCVVCNTPFFVKEKKRVNAILEQVDRASIEQREAYMNETVRTIVANNNTHNDILKALRQSCMYDKKFNYPKASKLLDIYFKIKEDMGEPYSHNYKRLILQKWQPYFRKL